MNFAQSIAIRVQHLDANHIYSSFHVQSFHYQCKVTLNLNSRSDSSEQTQNYQHFKAENWMQRSLNRTNDSNMWDCTIACTKRVASTLSRPIDPRFNQ